MANYSDAFLAGYNDRRRKKKKNNPHLYGTSLYNDYEKGWESHRLGLSVSESWTNKNPAPITRKPKTYVGFCHDRSGSMASLVRPSNKALNDQIDQLKRRTDQEIIVSMNTFGGRVQSVINLQPVATLSEYSNYYADGMTPLFDAVGGMIDHFRNVPDFNDKDVAFMVFVITDGYENSSRTWNSGSVNAAIRGLQTTDRWTFVFMVPPGTRDSFSRSFGVPAANIMEWEATEQGIQEYKAATMRSADSYFDSRAKGLTATQTFYTDLAQVKSTTVKAKLRDISKEIKVFDVQKMDKIRPFVERVLGRSMLKGAAFYQLVKTEKKVQDYKQIIIRDKKTLSVYSGIEARNLLGLPHNGTVKIVPGNHGQYDIFVQSTSVNRILPVGTQLIYWENAGQPFTTSY